MCTQQTVRGPKACAPSGLPCLVSHRSPPNPRMAWQGSSGRESHGLTASPSTLCHRLKSKCQVRGSLGERAKASVWSQTHQGHPPESS